MSEWWVKGGRSIGNGGACVCVVVVVIIILYIYLLLLCVYVCECVVYLPRSQILTVKFSSSKMFCGLRSLQKREREREGRQTQRKASKKERKKGE